MSVTSSGPENQDYIRSLSDIGRKAKSELILSHGKIVELQLSWDGTVLSHGTEKIVDSYGYEIVIAALLLMVWSSLLFAGSAPALALSHQRSAHELARWRSTFFGRARVCGCFSSQNFENAAVSRT